MNDVQNKKYIIVAEDDKYDATVYRIKLEEQGYEVAIVENGSDLLKKVKERKPNLVMLDLIMPKKDGFETLKELKEHDKTKDIPVIVLTNLGQQEDIERVKALGASDYFVKTNISIHDMVEKVKKYIS